jgi:hypothetical protein
VEFVRGRTVHAHRVAVPLFTYEPYRYVRFSDPAEPATRDLLLFCHGFCTALTAHHEGEDRELFRALAEQHPELRETLHKLRQDHSMKPHDPDWVS